MRLCGTAALVAGATGALAQTVTLANGTIQGAKCPDTNVNYFWSIPYGKAPTGDLRFAPPQAFDSKYVGTLDGTKAAPNCVQFGSSDVGIQQVESEDW
jgi:carboxylesterase type B